MKFSQELTPEEKEREVSYEKHEEQCGSGLPVKYCQGFMLAARYGIPKYCYNAVCAKCAVKVGLVDRPRLHSYVCTTCIEGPFL